MYTVSDILRDLDRGIMSNNNLTERLVLISDFSQGKSGKIFNDVAENNNEYIVLENNQPTAVLLSVKDYQEMQGKAAKLEELVERVENNRTIQQNLNLLRKFSISLLKQYKERASHQKERCLK